MLSGDMWNTLNSQGYVYHPGYSDEFTGGEDSFETPDPSKWNLYHPTGWKGNDKFTYSKDLAYVHNNNLVLEARPGDKFECGIVSQRWPVQYGYFEVRVKASDNKIASNFWFYDHAHYEIDVFEHFVDGLWAAQRMKSNVHHFWWDGKQMVDNLDWSSPAWMHGANVTEWNTYGVMREPWGIHFLCNGKVTRSIWKSSMEPGDWPNDRWLPGILDILVYDWQDGKFTPEFEKSFYYVDYFRAWVKPPQQ